MNITDVRWTYADNGLPVLELKIDGVEVTILPQQKPYLLDNGIVCVILPAGQEELLPPVRVPESRELGITAFSLEEATKDDVIVRLTREFIAAVQDRSFKPAEK